MTASPRITAALGPLLAAPAAFAHDGAASGGARMLSLLLGVAAAIAAVRRSGGPLRSGRGFGDRV